MRLIGKIEITARALEPVIHGGGSSGNTQTARRMEDVHGNRVPFISGNSIKHKMRDAAVRFALDAMNIPDQSMFKAEVDLLFSGGSLSASGAAINLQRCRSMEALFPALSLFGYSAGNAIVEGKAKFNHWHLVCAENAYKFPSRIQGHADSALRAGAAIREEFGTRHDQTLKAAGLRMLSGEVQDEQAKGKSKALEKKRADSSDKGDSVQMIYNFESIAAGATLFGNVEFASLTEIEQAALASAFHYAAIDSIDGQPVMTIGAKSAVGYGRVRLELASSLRVMPATFTDATSLAVLGDSAAASYTAHLRDRRDEIMAAIREACA